MKIRINQIAEFLNNHLPESIHDYNGPKKARFLDDNLEVFEMTVELFIENSRNTYVLTDLKHLPQESISFKLESDF